MSPMKRAFRIVLALVSLIGVSFVAFLVAMPPTRNEAVLPGSEEDVFIQYGRWLARVCPVKIGAMPQVLPSGELVRPPLPLPVPDAWMWFRVAPLSPYPGRSPVSASDAVEARRAAYAGALGRYAKARTEYLHERDALTAKLLAYIGETRIRSAVSVESGRERPRNDVLALLRPNTSLPSWPVLIAQADAVFSRMEEAQAVESEIVAILATKPFPQAGLPILPGTLGVALPDLGYSAPEGRSVLGILVQSLVITGVMILAAAACLQRVRPAPWARFLPSVPTTLAVVLAAGIVLGAEYLGALPGRGLHSADAAIMPLWPVHAGDDGLAPGYVLDMLWHLILPVGCLVAAGLVLRRGRRALLPWLLVISALVEQALDVPGLGRMLIHALQVHDRESFVAASVVLWGIGALPIWARRVESA